MGKIYAVFSKLTNNYRKCEKGQFAVWFALIAFPLLLALACAIDISQAVKTRQNITDALDMTVLAAVGNQNLTEEQRKEFSEAYFYDLVLSKKNTELTVNSSTAQLVELSATAKIPTMLSGALGITELVVSKKVAATITKGEVVCFLVLDPSSQNSFDVSYGSSLSAETCAVQVNSKSSTAARAAFGGVAQAKDFCVVGGGSGSFKPYLNTECGQIEDPYKGRVPPPSGPCLPISKVHYGFQSGNKAYLKPGHYCNGLDIVAMNVEFAPGIYTISGGPMKVSGTSNLKGDSVSFVFYGLDSYLEIGGGSTAQIKAPKDGSLAGLAFFQTLGAERKISTKLPVHTSQVTGGGAVSILGTAYFPDHKILFSGGSLSDSKAASTSFIGYQIEMNSGASVKIAVDHKKAGLPPILPRSDESVRLVK